MDKSKQSTITADTLATPISIYEQQIKTLENEKLELKLQSQQVEEFLFNILVNSFSFSYKKNQHLHNKEVTRLEKTILDQKRQLIERESQLKLSEFEQNKLTKFVFSFSIINVNESSFSINQNFSEQLKEKTAQIDQLQKHVAVRFSFFCLFFSLGTFLFIS